MLPTRRIVDEIYRQAEVKLDPQPLTEQREAVATFVQHNGIIEQQRKGHVRGDLIAGIKKDVVLTPRLDQHAGHVAIYGWHKLDGQPIQPLTTVHIATYVDYSHGIRLISRDVVVDGKTMSIDDVLASSELMLPAQRRRASEDFRDVRILGPRRRHHTCQVMNGPILDIIWLCMS